MGWFANLFKPKELNFPPWVKVTPQGSFYIDLKDERWKRYWVDQVKYYDQWQINDGKLVRTKFTVKDKPNWKDYTK